jgi:hypothetical protein
MAPPRGRFGNRLDTAAGRKKEAEMQAAADAAARGDAAALQMAAQIASPISFQNAIASTVQQNAPAPSSNAGVGDLRGIGREGTDTDIYGNPKVPGRSYLAGVYQPSAPAPTGPSQEELNARRNAVDMLIERLAQWGISGLSGVINDLVIEFGPESESTIMSRIKQTEPYKQRFKGLIGLRERGITDIPNEGAYLALERDYREVFREAGLRDYLGTSGSQAEYDAIAQIVGDFSLSVNEVRDRVTDAQRVVAETPQEVRDSLQQFYGIDPALLTQYVLDPENTTTQIQRRANAAIVGGYATRAGLEFGAGTSERIGEFLGRGEDIIGTAIEPQLTEISDIEKATKRLADIERKALTDEEVALSTLDLDQGAREKVRGLQSRERARFGGSSAIKSAALKRPRSI